MIIILIWVFLISGSISFPLANESNHVFVYSNDIQEVKGEFQNHWIEHLMIKPTDLPNQNIFGDAVAIHGNYSMISRFFSVDVYKKIDGSWQYYLNIIPED